MKTLLLSILLLTAACAPQVEFKTNKQPTTIPVIVSPPPHLPSCAIQLNSSHVICIDKHICKSKKAVETVSGIDINCNGSLSSDEITSSSVVCQPAKEKHEDDREEDHDDNDKE